MTDHNHGQPKARPSLLASPLFWLSAGMPTFCAFLAFLCSWPLGPAYADEGGVTKLRLAVALIALALCYAVMCLVILLLRTLRRLDDVSAQLSELIDNQKKDN